MKLILRIRVQDVLKIPGLRGFRVWCAVHAAFFHALHAGALHTNAEEFQELHINIFFNDPA